MSVEADRPDRHAAPVSATSRCTVRGEHDSRSRGGVEPVGPGAAVSATAFVMLGSGGDAHRFEHADVRRPDLLGVRAGSPRAGRRVDEEVEIRSTNEFVAFVTARWGSFDSRRRSSRSPRRPSRGRHGDGESRASTVREARRAGEAGEVQASARPQAQHEEPAEHGTTQIVATSIPADQPRTRRSSAPRTGSSPSAACTPGPHHRAGRPIAAGCWPPTASKPTTMTQKYPVQPADTAAQPPARCARSRRTAGDVTTIWPHPGDGQAGRHR